LMVPWHSAKKILEDSRGDQSVFYNFTLGLPYQPKDMSVSRGDILRCLSPIQNPMTGNAMGVDVGKVKHYVIGNKYGVFRIGTAETWDEIESLMLRYDAYTVIDAMPNPDEPANLAKKYRGKVFIHYYVADKKQIGTIRWGESDKFGVVESDRTKIIDSVVADFSTRAVKFNLREDELEEYIKHWGFLYRIVVENEKGQVVPHWVHPDGKPDHFAHAHVYWKIAMEKTLSHGDVITTPASLKQDENKAHPVIMGGKSQALDLSGVAKRAFQQNQLRGDWRTK
jgi:hypothetical protein